MEVLNDIFGIKIDYNQHTRLAKRRDVMHEVELQIKSLEDNGYRLLTTIHNDDESVIVYRSVFELGESEDYAVYINTMIIRKKGRLVHCPRLLGTYVKEENRIEIGDIQFYGDSTNKGYGSIILNALFEIADKQKVNKITGWISSVDWDHIDRLEHFYLKNGFKVELNHEIKHGTIEWLRK